MYPPYIDLAAGLNEIVPGNFPKMTMLANAGAEAVENAVKIARYATKRPAIIAFENGFHGLSEPLFQHTLTVDIRDSNGGDGRLVRAKWAGLDRQ